MIHEVDVDVTVTSTLAFGESKGVIILGYNSEDPFAVTMTFNTNQTWFLSRDMIAEALDNPDRTRGDGDVSILNDTDSGDVVFFLSSHEGTGAVKIDYVDVVEFMGETFEITPPGNEGPAVDDELEIFLSSLAITEE